MSDNVVSIQSSSMAFLKYRQSPHMQEVFDAIESAFDTLKQHGIDVEETSPNTALLCAECIIAADMHARGLDNELNHLADRVAPDLLSLYA